MELATITMDRNRAREAFLDYRRAVRERHDQEDEQIMRGYRSLAQGHQLIRLIDVLRAGGTKTVTLMTRRWNGSTRRDERVSVERRVPLLAATRADARMCFTAGITDEGGIEFTADRTPRDLADRNRRDRVRIPAATFEPGNASTWGWPPLLKAIVPTVPPPLRPAHKLSGYTMLWEAEWSQHPEPPADPALLKHIGGDLYAVVAIWDLTELEQAVLAGRA